MGLTAKKLVVEIVGDSSSLERALTRSGKAADDFGTKVRKTSLLAGAALGGGLAIAAKVGFTEIAEGQKVAAQTAAALESTGGAANVTAKQVANLATEQSNLTGIDDELIQSGENLLLTFKNVRNEVGKGNAIFDRATKSALDLSTAGFGSVESTSKMMGKALNDPIKGMTALGRAGVTFSEDQKKAIKSMVETGDTLGAQRSILKEIESQVGGSAEAYGNTLPGQLNKAKNALEETAASVTVVLLPALTGLAKTAAKVAQFFTEHKTLAKALAGTLLALSGILIAVGVSTKVYAAAQAIVAGATKVWAAAQWLLNQAFLANPFVLIVVALVALGAALVIAYKKSETFRNIVNAAFEKVQEIGEKILDFFKTLGPAFKEGFDIALKAVSVWWNAVRPIFEGFMDIIQGLVDIVIGIFTGDWSRAWDGAKKVVSGAFDVIKGLILAAPTLLLQGLLAVGRAIISGIEKGIEAAWPTVKAWFASLPGKVVAFLADAGQWLLEKGKALIAGLLRGIIDKYVDVATWYASLAGKIIRALADAGSWLVEKGAQVIGGLLRGFADKVGDVISFYTSLPGKILGALGNLGSLLYNAGIQIIKGLISGITDQLDDLYGMVSGIGGKIASLKGPIEDDRKLLVPQGRAIIEGLIGGIQQRLPDLERVVSEIAPSLEVEVPDVQAGGFDFSAAQPIPPTVAESLTLTTEAVTTATTEVTTFTTAITNLPTVAAAAFAALTSAIKNAIKPLPAILDLGTVAAEALAQAIHNIGAAAYYTRAALKDTADEIVALNNKINSATGSDRPLPRRAAGGPVRAGQAYIVGEVGPELFVPSQSGTIHTASDTASMAAVGGMTVNLLFNGPTVGTSREFEDTVRRALYDVSRRNPGSGLVLA